MRPGSTRAPHVILPPNEIHTQCMSKNHENNLIRCHRILAVLFPVAPLSEPFFQFNQLIQGKANNVPRYPFVSYTILWLFHTYCCNYFFYLSKGFDPAAAKKNQACPAGNIRSHGGCSCRVRRILWFPSQQACFWGGCLQWFMSSGGTASAGRQEVIMGWGLPGFKRCPACRSCPIDGGSPVRLFAFNGPRLLCRSGSGPDHAMTHGYRHHEGMKGCEDKKAGGGRDARGIPAI